MEVLVNVVVYGPGCSNCRRLEAQARAALATLGQDAQVTKVTDLSAMVEAGVMRTPALGVNGVILLQGRVPEVAELSRILSAALPPAADG
jgi:small redox-active disulfide protein 2